MNNVLVNAQAFRDALSLVAFCVSKNVSQYSMWGVKMTIKNEVMTLVATDGRRLAMHTLHCFDYNEDVDIILSAGTVKALLSSEYKPKKSGSYPLIIKIVSDIITISYHEKESNHTLSGGIFPDYSKVLPNEDDYGTDNSGNEPVSAIYLAEACKAIGKHSDFVHFLYNQKTKGSPVIVKTRIIGYTHIIMPKRT